MTERSLLTLGDWHQAYLDGAPSREWLGAHAGLIGPHDPAMLGEGWRARMAELHPA
ncbi:hypothetical protein [Pelomonas sp. Root1237]|uniref:hypothetical protein n=1 Tax=Pelomonas sp. Root1237 TaxID=1736434 RepID=UPI0012FAD234|nr:hypothetical protein [Pelomonas sp. Root1237]